MKYKKKLYSFRKSVIIQMKRKNYFGKIMRTFGKILNKPYRDIERNFTKIWVVFKKCRRNFVKIVNKICRNLATDAECHRRKKIQNLSSGSYAP